MTKNLKRKIFELLDPNTGGTVLDKITNTVIVFLIVANTLAVIFETVVEIYNSYKSLFIAFEYISIIFFSIEFILRVWTCTLIPKYHKPISGRLKFIISPAGLIDLLAILPFYLPRILKIDLRFIRVLRLIRFFRFFKLSRYLNASKIISRVFKSKKDELIFSFIVTFFLIVVASCIMYYTEHDAQPDKFSSIPETMWWSVATLTTVGYGDVYPITTLGKTLTAIISILGIGMFALPAGILASGFADEFKSVKSKSTCPHCGEIIQ